MKENDHLANSPSAVMAYIGAHHLATMGVLAAIAVAADEYVATDQLAQAEVRKRAAENIALLAGAFQCLNPKQHRGEAR